MESRRVCFECVNVCVRVCVCDSVGGGPLVQMQAFSFLFCFVPPPPNLQRDLEGRRIEETEKLFQRNSQRDFFFFFMDRKTRRELLALGVQLIRYRTL